MVRRKLTEEDVLAIRASSDRQVDLAARYGITQPAVSAIQRGLIHSDLPGARPNGRRLTDEEVEAIRASEEGTTALADEYGVSRGTIYKVKMRQGRYA